MKTRILTVFTWVALAAACAGDEADVRGLSEAAPAPTAEEFAAMVKFSRNPNLKRDELASGYYFNLGEAVWVHRYATRDGEGRHSYVLGLYKNGTLFGRDRAQVEEYTRHRIEKMKKAREDAPLEQSPEDRQAMDEFLPLDQMETRGDGRKVYFCFMGWQGEGMDMTAAGFSSIGEHDLLLWHTWERERYGGQFKTEPEPASELPAVFEKIERQLAAREGAEPAQTAGTEASPPAAPPAPSPVSATKEKPFVNGLGMRFVPVQIQRGVNKEAAVEERVLLFSVWETRISDYAAFADQVADLSENWRDAKFAEITQTAAHPVVSVRWEDAGRFCEWLTERERRAGIIGSSDRYRLPSDHEWSCAVGIGEHEDADLLPESKSARDVSKVCPWGEAWPPPKGTGNFGISKGYEDDFPFTAPVGSFRPNERGLYDLAGNVMEFSSDFIAGGWSPLQGTKYLSARGSCFLTSDQSGSLSSRRSAQSSSGAYFVGFRCVLERSVAKGAEPK